MIEIAGSRLRVTGAMVIASATALKEEGLAALDRGATIVDLGGVTDADSAAVAVLLAWTRAAQDKGRPFAVIGVPESIRSLAALYGVADLLPLS